MIVRSKYVAEDVKEVDEDGMRLEMIEATPDQMTLLVLTIEELEY